MRRTYSAIFSFVFLGLVGCGKDGSTAPDAAREPDAMVSIDGPPAPAMITVTGTAVSRGIGGASPVPQAEIAGFRNRDEVTPVATTMTDAQGNFTLVIQ